jgi:hypothetical protein
MDARVRQGANRSDSRCYREDLQRGMARADAESDAAFVARLPPGLLDGHGDRVGQIQATLPGPHG